MFKIILVAVGVAVVGVLVFAATRPSHFVVTRTAVIDAPPEKLEAMVSDFHQWSLWSPWEKLDPGMTRTYGGPASGVGSTYAWVGNDKVGSGGMEIEKVTPGREVVFGLHFLKPFKADNTGRFVFEPQGAGATQGHLVDGGQESLHRQADGLGLQHGPDDRQGLREGLGRHEGRGRKASLIKGVTTLEAAMRRSGNRESEQLRRKP
ncbi:SRPBCC family protein [Caulobacter segnis]